LWRFDAAEARVIQSDLTHADKRLRSGRSLRNCGDRGGGAAEGDGEARLAVVDTLRGAGLDGLEDEPGRGRKPSIPAAKFARVVA
jgi:hypothetical protein